MSDPITIKESDDPYRCLEYDPGHDEWTLFLEAPGHSLFVYPITSAEFAWLITCIGENKTEIAGAMGE